MRFARRRVASNPVGELDLHLFNEGTHRHLHRCLGAHPDATGTWFAVWAPNAASVDVLGDFDGWSGQQMEPIGRSGIWSRARRRARSSGSRTATPSRATTASGWRSPTRSARRRTSRRRRRR